MTSGNLNYTTDTYGSGNPARPAAGFSSWGHRTESLPYSLGNGKVREMAREIADDLIHAAWENHGPVVWVTSNSYMPPMRDIPLAERVYQADSNRDGAQWAWLVEMVEDHLSAASVYLGAPDYDNCLYVVDLARWQYRDPTFSTPNFPPVPDDYSDDINDEWEPCDPDAVDDNAENPRE